MKTKSVPNSIPANDPGRCQHRTISGKRCRLSVVDSRSGLCYRHAALHSEAAKGADLRATLAGDTAQFEDAYEVNKFLSKLLILLSEDRIAPRRAAVMAYTCNLILRSLSVRIHELRAFGEDEPQRVDVDFGGLPRPNRQLPLSPNSDSATTAASLGDCAAGLSVS